MTKLIGFLSLEERKGVDHFDARRFLMFKGLFRNYGDSFMHLFRPHLESLVEQDLESAHRCAAEIIAGMFMFLMLLCTLHYEFFFILEYDSKLQSSIWAKFCVVE